jgi:hypothetical protein
MIWQIKEGVGRVGKSESEVVSEEDSSTLFVSHTTDTGATTFSPTTLIKI